jgi:hypothetical protein
MEWQLIETAPKDGTSVLLSDGKKITLAWFEEYGVFTDLLDIDEDTQEYVPQPLSFAPTHWMPLPAPPLDTNK